MYLNFGFYKWQFLALGFVNVSMISGLTNENIKFELEIPLIKLNVYFINKI